MTTSTDHLTFSLTDFKLAQGQMVPVHVQLVHLDGTMQDVTAGAMYMSDDTATATLGNPGQINGVQAGSATITASLGVAMPATVKATVTAALCHPVINELMTGSALSAADEWVELYNPCTNAVDVTSWTLDYRAANTTGATDSSTLRPLSGPMAPGELRLFSGTAYLGASDGPFMAGTGMAATGGAVGLRAGPKDTGELKDSIAYGAVASGHPFTEKNPAPVIDNGKSVSRRPFDGNDSDDNATDFVIVTMPTPRALNVP